MAKYETVIHGNFNQIVLKLEENIIKNGVSMNLVDESNYTLGGFPVAVRVYDKYYARNGNRASLSLTMAGNQDSVFISAIGSGGGQGILFNFSWGAEGDMVAIVQDIVENMME